MADVSGFSAMMGRDEERTTELIRAFHSRVRGTVDKHEGRVVDTAGDSVFGSFDSVVNAVRCAKEIQDDQETSNQAAPPEERITTRIGIHLGDVIVEDENVYGDGVNIAARLEQVAEPGGICVSEAVYQQVHTKLDLGFQDLGVQELKNIQQPVRIYGLAAREGEPARLRIETRPQPPVPMTAPTEQAGPVSPLAQRQPTPASVQAWYHEVVRAGLLVPGVLGVALILSDLLLFPSGGVLPTGGAILLGTVLGGVWTRLSGRRGNRLIGLGLGILSGALFTGWSGITDGMFVLGGLAVIASGVSMNFAPPTAARRRRGGRGRGRRRRRVVSGRRR